MKKKIIVKDSIKKINVKEKKSIKKIVVHKKEKKSIKKIVVHEKIKAEKEEKKGKARVLESYNLEVDKAAVNVEIDKSEAGMIYRLSIPEIEPATNALLEEVRSELLTITSFGVGEVIDQKSLGLMKKGFMENASRILREKMPGIQKSSEDFLIGILMQEMLGIGKIEFLISDSNLEEVVVVNSKEPIRVYHKKYGWLITNIKVDNEEDIINYANIIARRVGRQITVLSPLLDAHIVTGDRANAVLYPIATKGNTLTIRKFARDPWTIVDLINNKTVDLDVAALLWLGIEYEMNIIFSGGTASGKTVFLNACMPFMPPNHRLISIEDTRELMLPDFLYWCPLVTRTPNPEGKGEVSMLDLLINSLRMRPDRIILGEMRRQKEAEVLFEAMHTGHSVYATVHADTAAETVQRLTNPPINIPASMIKAVNLNVVMFRDRRKGIRRVYQVAEFIAGKDGVTPNILYRWVPENDEIIEHNESLSFFEELTRHTGMSQNDITNDLKMKKDILKWMISHNIRSLNELGKVINLYYTDYDLLSEIIKKNQVDRIKEKEK